MTESLTVRAATSADIDALQHIKEEVAINLLGRGIPWNPNSTSREHLETWANEGVLWVAVNDGQVVGMVAVWWSDPTDHWPKADLAVFVHDLMASPTVKGKRVGERLLAWVERYAQGRGRALVRLDCDASNDRLCRYYEQRGYEKMGADSGFALYQKRS